MYLSKILPYYLSLLQDDKPVVANLKGMCNNSTRRLTWSRAADVNLEPLFIPSTAFPDDAEDSLSIEISVTHITTDEDYEIFNAFRMQNVSKVLEMIDLHKGINAFDEWGQTPLMLAVQNTRVDVVAALMNTRMPKVDVNAAKTSGTTALFYAVQKATPSIVSALLKRGADPNAKLLQEVSSL
ncbi:ankyrin repeat domain-containing protein [archaeon]|nr:MAG: ankyrin repeat domain-containing protein [archaeon]